MTAVESLPVIYPVGHHACGKSKVSEHLVQSHGFSVIETGAMVRATYKAVDPDRTRYANIGAFAAAVEETDPNYFIDRILVDMRRQSIDQQPTGIIINGMRTLTHLQRLQAQLPNNPQAVVWIDSPRTTLKQRWETREGRSLSDDQFDELLQFDNQLGLQDVRRHADAVVLNDDSVETLNYRVETALRRLGVIATGSCVVEV